LRHRGPVPRAVTLDDLPQSFVLLLRPACGLAAVAHLCLSESTTLFGETSFVRDQIEKASLLRRPVCGVTRGGLCLVLGMAGVPAVAQRRRRAVRAARQARQGQIAPGVQAQSGGMILRVEFVPEHLGLGVPVAHAGLLDLRETISAAGKIAFGHAPPLCP